MTDDATLLGRFSSQRDENAFAMLIERHGPMVLGCCRRVLGCGADAEDAAQAVFLILAKEARRIDGRRPLAPWLHRVAMHAARDVERERRARQGRERRAAGMMPTATPDAHDATLAEALEHGLSRLPERERQALILVHLQQMSQQEAADQLGCSPGTLASWLHRGRERLRAALRRRRIVISGSTLLLALARLEPAELPPGFPGLAETATRFASGALPTTAGAHVLALANHGVHAMHMSRLLTHALVALALLFVTGLAGWQLMAADNKPAPPPVSPPTPPAIQPDTTVSAIMTARAMLTAIADKDTTAYLRLLSPDAMAKLHDTDALLQKSEWPKKIRAEIPGLTGERAWPYQRIRPESPWRRLMGRPALRDTDLLVWIFDPARSGRSATHFWTRIFVMRQEAGTWKVFWMEDDWCSVPDMEAELLGAGAGTASGAGVAP